MADSTAARHLVPGDKVEPHQFVTISGETVDVPDPRRLVHLELRRFAGCPICNVHLRSVIKRKDELAAAGIEEVVVFHSTDEELRKYQTELPFPVVADPDKKLYAEFGVERAARSILNPRAWPAMFKGIGHSIGAVARREEKAPPLVHENGSLGLPGDFLIASDGSVVASKYGTHAFDQWTVDEILELAKAQQPSQPAGDASASATAGAGAESSPASSASAST